MPVNRKTLKSLNRPVSAQIPAEPSDGTYTDLQLDLVLQDFIPPLQAIHRDTTSPFKGLEFQRLWSCGI